MNFTISYYESEDSETELWGRLDSNSSSYTGILGEMVDGGANIALGDIYHTPYYMEHMDLSVPYSSECLTFLTPEALTDNSWQTLILPFRYTAQISIIAQLFFHNFSSFLFSAEMWGGVLFFLLCVGLVFYALARVSTWIKQSSNRTTSHLHQNRRVSRASVHLKTFGKSKFPLNRVCAGINNVGTSKR